MALQKRHQRKSTITEISNLPSEIVFNILSRLPLTCLLRSAKYVCKVWYFVIYEPIFSDLHLSHSLHNPPGLLHALSSTDSSLYFAENQTTVMKLPGDLVDMNKYRSFTFCRGLMAYQSLQDESTYICNPIIGDQVKIPAPNVGISNWGFGYARSSNKYKYVRCSLENQPNYQSKTHCSVFTLGEESWREVGVPQYIAYCSNPVYCNGALHWNLPNVSIESEIHVLSFDLDTERFRPRKVLSIDTRRNLVNLLPWLNSVYLTVIGDTVAYVTRNRNCTQQVWMLVEEDENKWVEKYRFSVPTPGLHGVEFRLSGSLMNGDLYGIETTREPPGNYLESSAECHEITKTRCLSYSVDCETFTSVKLSLLDDADKNGDECCISPCLLTTHVGTLISPSKIVAAAVEQLN